MYSAQHNGSSAIPAKYTPYIYLILLYRYPSILCKFITLPVHRKSYLIRPGFRPSNSLASARIYLNCYLANPQFQIDNWLPV